MLRKAYQNIKKNGDRLAEVDHLIDWEAFKPIIQPIYDNQGPMGGRPNTDPVVMVKMVFACFCYNLVQLCTLGGG
jgi:IS5 family transposase